MVCVCVGGGGGQFVCVGGGVEGVGQFVCVCGGGQFDSDVCGQSRVSSCKVVAAHSGYQCVGVNTLVCLSERFFADWSE